MEIRGWYLYNLDLNWRRTEGIYHYLNDLHQTIKFISEHSSSVTFLDTSVSITHGKTSTVLYVKPTDTHQCLLSSSCQPYHTKRSIPYSLGFRWHNIQQTCYELVGHLKKKKSSGKSTKKNRFRETKNWNRASQKENALAQPSHSIRCHLYNPTFPNFNQPRFQEAGRGETLGTRLNFNNIITKHSPILKSSSRWKKVFRDFLVKA